MGLPQKSLTGIQEFFYFLFPRIPLKEWKAKLERTHFYEAQSGKITVKKLPVFPDPVSAAMSTSPPPRIRGIASD